MVFVVQNVVMQLGVKRNFLIYTDAISANIKNHQQQEHCFINASLILRQKTCYSFKRKAMAAMANSGHIKLKGTVDVDEFFVGGYEEGKVGRSKGKKKQVLMGIKM